MELFKKKKVFFWVVVVALFFFAGILAFRQATPLKTVLIKIKGAKIKVELAATAVDRYNGLSRRDSLCPDCGMLFEFNDSADREFVMRAMKFPLDIIFINQGKIIKIAADLPAEGANPVNFYLSDGLADSVLEVNAGYCARQGIEIGDFIFITR